VSIKRRPVPFKEGNRRKDVGIPLRVTSVAVTHPHPEDGFRRLTLARQNLTQMPEDEGRIKLLLSAWSFNPFAIPKVSRSIGFESRYRSIG